MKPIGNANPPPAVVVVYDGACPLCSREIGHYRRRTGAERLEWVDATRDNERLSALGLSQQEALAKFHVRDHQGSWHIGASGFVLLWSQLQPYALLAKTVRALHLLPLMDWGYALFLKWRGRRPCDEQRCGLK